MTELPTNEIELRRELALQRQAIEVLQSELRQATSPVQAEIVTTLRREVLALKRELTALKEARSVSAAPAVPAASPPGTAPTAKETVDYLLWLKDCSTHQQSEIVRLFQIVNHNSARACERIGTLNMAVHELIKDRWPEVSQLNWDLLQTFGEGQIVDPARLPRTPQRSAS